MNQRDAVKLINDILAERVDTVSRETRMMVLGSAKTILVLLYRAGYELVKKEGK